MNLRVDELKNAMRCDAMEQRTNDANEGAMTANHLSHASCDGASLNFLFLFPHARLVAVVASSDVSR